MLTLSIIAIIWFYHIFMFNYAHINANWFKSRVGVWQSAHDNSFTMLTVTSIRICVTTICKLHVYFKTITIIDNIESSKQTLCLWQTYCWWLTTAAWYVHQDVDLQGLWIDTDIWNTRNSNVHQGVLLQGHWIDTDIWNTRNSNVHRGVLLQGHWIDKDGQLITS